MHVLHLMALLLDYPTPDLIAVLPELRARLAEDPDLPVDALARLTPLLDRLTHGDIYDVQEAYVQLFDRGRAHSLHLFEHVHGESRDRGQAMVDLRQRYLDAGLEPSGNELPDYLPLFLDYCSVLPEAQARATLAEPGVVLAAMSARLAAKESDYAPLIAVLCDIAGVAIDEEAATAAPPSEDPDDLAALDAAWAEEEIRFGAEAVPDPAAPCPKATDLVARIRTPIPPIAAARS